MNPHEAGGAFVLVSTILLVGLATILVVTAAMMSRVERKAASNSAKVDQARANALFALDVALNQLQREAGPDQRVTARAEILDTTNAPALSTTNNVKHPLWTGVWKTGTNGLDIVNSGTPQRQTSLGSTNPTMNQKITNAAWLVSGFGSLDPSTFAGSTNSPNATAAVLAKNLGTNTDKVQVLAPLVPIVSGGTTNGAYAYWVSDEGVKAKINKTDPTLGVNPNNDPSRNQLHFLVPQAAAPHKGSTEFGATDLRTNTTDLLKISTLQSLANVTGLSGLAGTNAAKIAPDFTTYGFGVLADVRRGGLRKDLTAALESPNAFNTLATTYGHGAQMLYRSAASAGLTVPAPVSGAPYYFDSVDQTNSNPKVDGVSWFSLYSHYNSYKGIMTSPSGLGTGGAAPTSSGNASAAPNVASTRVYSVTNTGGTVRTGFLMPTAVAFRLDVALSSYQDPAGDWRLRLHYYPQLVLHNPYSARISLTNFQFERRVGAFSTSGSYSTNAPTLTCIRITASDGTNETSIPYFRVNQAPTNVASRFFLRTRAGDCNTLEPGETRVFALAEDNTNFPTPTAAIDITNLVSTNSMSADFSQQCDVLTDVSTNGFSSGTPFSTTNSATTISVAIAQAKLRMQNVDTYVFPDNLRWPKSDNIRVMTGGASDLQAKDANGTPIANGTSISMRIDQLTSSRRIIGFYIRQKGLKPSAGVRNYSNATNNVPIYMGNFAALSPVDDNFSYVWREIYLSPFGGLYQNNETDVNMSPSGSTWQTSFGGESVGVAGNPTRYVLRDVPNQPLVSLGQFIHMSATRYINATGDYAAYGTGSMFVGGSCASPAIPTEYNALAQIQGSGGTPPTPQRTIYTDDSFLANEALFDRFFFSTVPPAGAPPAGTTYPATWTAFNSANTGATLSDSTKPLLNSRLRPYYTNGIGPLMASLRDVDKAAANLMLNGAFNINSTSVSAWKAFLGGLSGNDLRLFNAGTGVATTEATIVGGVKGVAFSRFWSASGETAPNTIWSGLRVLSDSELDDLVTKIVAEVKTRGPFLSLADFLNRRLGPNTSSLNRCGTLQAAIDKTSPDINVAAKNAGVAVNASVPTENPTPYPRAPNLILDNMKDASGNTWNTALGVPGYLMQQDIVQAIAPAIAARSDTFVIRTYGEVRNPTTGNVESRAWIEAVVQRTPDLFDTSQTPETSLSVMNATNQNFGRRFQVVSFRWLHPNEI